jgi:hypothetical protein
MTKRDLESLVTLVLAELNLKGHVINTVDLDDPPGTACSVVSLPSGIRHVLIDLSLDKDDGRVTEDIKHQLTAPTWKP